MSVDADSLETATAQDGFNAVSKKDISAAVKDALKIDQTDYKISKAFVNDKGQYKLEVTKEDGTTSELNADSKNFQKTPHHLENH